MAHWQKCRYLCQFLSYLRSFYRSEIPFRFGFRQAPQNHRSAHISYPDFFFSSNFLFFMAIVKSLRSCFFKKIDFINSFNSILRHFVCLQTVYYILVKTLPIGYLNLFFCLHSYNNYTL